MTKDNQIGGSRRNLTFARFLERVLFPKGGLNCREIASRHAFWITLLFCSVLPITAVFLVDNFSEHILTQDDNQIQAPEEYDSSVWPLASQGLANGGFSEGLKHWCTGDGGTVVVGAENAKSDWFLDQGHFGADAPSLRIECSKGPCRTYYVSSPVSQLLEDPYSRSREPSSWLRIEHGSKMSLSFHYRGYGPTVYLNVIAINGEWRPLLHRELVESADWVSFEDSVTAPEDAAGIGVEITLNCEKCRTWFDDVKLLVSPEGA